MTAPGSQAAERLLTELRAEIARADSKASVLVAALGTTVGLFTGLLTRHDARLSGLSAGAAATWWAGVSALVFSMCALLLAVLPRYRNGTWAPGQPLAYFGDIQQAARQEQLAAALSATECGTAAGFTIALTETSRIAARKHQWMRVGLIAFCAGVTLLPLSLLLG
ncbi:Pycsar system effector family protein [Streptomyces alboflavus]|uniref:Pycsar system effector family protein n=1 Tax=Streptomyces alboflavus TaxID=67267 RepID=UPI000F658C53|nr:Pycsar system effector family protein [Streptomyces alboflavus]